MKFSRITVLSLCFVIVLSGLSVAQTRKELEQAAAHVINGLLGSSLGPQYKSIFVIDADSVSGNADLYFDPVEDPYGTLRNCFIFLGGRGTDSGNFCGVYKEGTVLWRSDTAIMGQLPKLYTVEDLNRSGSVDIVVESSIMGWRSQLWIFSWDGQVGRRISAIDSDGLSVIQSISHSFELFDANGDGIIEIRDGNIDDGSQSWSWNGSGYGSWPDTPHLPSTTLWPRNKINIDVSSTVRDSTDGFVFNYAIYSKPTSIQDVDFLRVWGQCDSIKGNSAPAGWVGGYNFNKGGDGTFFTFWHSNLTGYSESIRPGRTKTGFITIASGLPAIVIYDAQGANAPPNYKLMTEQQVIEVEKEDETMNSVHGITVAPVNLPSPFVALNFLDTLTSYTTQSRSLGWIKDQGTADKYTGYLSSAKTSLQQNNTGAARSTLQQVLQQVNTDSTSNLTSEAYALIRYNTEYLLAQLPACQPGFIVKLVSSTGARLTTGSLQYYEGSWKDAASNNDGTFTINTASKTLSLRMTYQYGTQTKSNVTVGPDTAVFQTVDAQIKLQDSKGSPLDTGTVQYYAGAWRSLGSTVNGTATMELLPNSYSFRMTYAYGSNDKQQDIGANPTVVFQTVNATVQLKNSQGSFIDQGTVQYYAGAWRSFGATTGGITTIELLPNNYSFRMTYEGVSNDKQHDISANSTVVYSTVLSTVTVTNSQNQPVDGVQASYYSGSWRQIGSTVNGQVTKELLPANLTFRITYGTNHQDKSQNLAASSVVQFSIP